MNMRGKRFEVDRANGKLPASAPGLGEHDRRGCDHRPDRLGAGRGAGQPAAGSVAYGVLAYFAGQAGRPPEAPCPGRAPPVSARRSRERMRNLDLRMQAIETYVTSSNSRLAREIEDLR